MFVVDRPSLDRLRVITAAAPDDDDDAATNGDDEFGWQPDEDDRIVLPAQQRFFENVVLPLLPTRKLRLLVIDRPCLTDGL